MSIATQNIFSEVLQSLDAEPFQPILERDIYSRIHKEMAEGHELIDEETAELTAFAFIETSKRNDAAEAHYKPQQRELIDGTVKQFPKAELITENAINYWVRRSEEVAHPVLKARYAGMAYELSQQVTGRSVHFSVAERYTNALLDTVSQQLYRVPVYAVGKLGRALDVSIKLNNKKLVDQSKEAILALETELTTPEKLSYWGFSYDLLLAPKRKIANETEEKVIISLLEKRFSDVILNDSGAAEYAAEKLLDHYHRKGNKGEVKRVLAELEKSFDHANANLSAFHKAHGAERIYKLYKQYQLNDEAVGALKKLRAFGRLTDQEMKVIGAEMKLEKEELDKYADAILKGDSSETIFARIIFQHLPRLTSTKEELKQLVGNMPTQYILGSDLQDIKGRKVARIPPITEDEESYLVQHTSKTMRINTLFLHVVFEEATHRDIINVREITRFLHRSCIIEKDRFAIIERALEAYFANDYVVTMHLLIPQFEEAIRNLVEFSGGNVLVEGDKGAFNLKTFDHLLKDPIVMDIFGEDMAFYFRVLFTDKRGWNIRNNFAHGMLETGQFMKQNADRILHAFLCLALVRPAKQG